MPRSTHFIISYYSGEVKLLTGGKVMLFDERPKESLKDFYDMRESVERFVKGVEGRQAVNPCARHEEDW